MSKPLFIFLVIAAFYLLRALYVHDRCLANHAIGSTTTLTKSYCERRDRLYIEFHRYIETANRSESLSK